MIVTARVPSISYASLSASIESLTKNVICSNAQMRIFCINVLGKMGSPKTYWTVTYTGGHKSRRVMIRCKDTEQAHQG